MRVLIICPAPPGSRLGNRITALRWRRLLRELGHEARIASDLGAGRYDLLIALHARRSAEAVRLSRERYPARPIVVALTGTDLYRDIHCFPEAKRSLELADRLIVLHALGGAELPERFRGRVSVVPQSASPVPSRPPASSSSAHFDVAVVGHLRVEKDPFRTALAARRLPAASKIRVLHAGRALSAEMERLARAEERVGPRYKWLGELPRWRARALIAKSRLLALTSEMEGGANVLTEAIVAGTPVLASRIPCAEAILGKNYPGLFSFRSTAELARLLRRAEDEPRFLAALTRACVARRPSLSPAREKAALRELVRCLERGAKRATAAPL